MPKVWIHTFGVEVAFGGFFFYIATHTFGVNMVFRKPVYDTSRLQKKIFWNITRDGFDWYRDNLLISIPEVRV